MNTAHAHSSHLKLVYYTQYKSLKSPPTLDSDKNCLKRQYYWREMPVKSFCYITLCVDYFKISFTITYIDWYLITQLNSRHAHLIIPHE